VIDDDDSVRRSLERLLRSVDLDVQTFSTAREFLAQVYRIVPPASSSI
jgi:FixJ family two-component response regulator